MVSDDLGILLIIFGLGLIVGILLCGGEKYYSVKSTTQNKFYNSEVYEWVDYKGNVRRMVVKREVHT